VALIVDITMTGVLCALAVPLDEVLVRMFLYSALSSALSDERSKVNIFPAIW
jgi:hypothetical protein